MQTLEKYEKLKKKYEALKQKHKYVLKNYDEDVKYIMELEDQILGVNTKTIKVININNNRFINNN